GTLNAKFSPGGLVDIEYLVQGLQITHGHRQAELRQTNTYQAMQALAKHHILAPEAFTALSDAYIFLRHLIDALRMVRGHAKDLTVPPVDSDDFAFLARRLNYDQAHLPAFNDTLHHHVATVQTLNSELLDQ
ncbi:MAG: hypothetical protein R3264_13205, partial [Anaerolineae bacterium]|nr:hypothetical protein [Anaerolineae bacterium]